MGIALHKIPYWFFMRINALRHGALRFIRFSTGSLHPLRPLDGGCNQDLKCHPWLFLGLGADFTFW
jgi:hypothetical protein